ncbi:methyltransferase domain-containing protein [Paraglaciecola sp. 2405UD69-4]|uniref:methyltransferase domain-containing protein n=1 Tax=Paraglaciecola sp. 2405UD69-4 TaxID=3391836 RepID=UPI0039C9E5E9
MSSEYYNKRAKDVSEQYLSLTFEEVHNSWIHQLPAILDKPNLAILDVGAGAGRDVKRIAELVAENQPQGSIAQVYGVEPSHALLQVGQQTTKGQNVHWLQDSLPSLDKTTKLELSFDLILLSAVWMHVPPSQRSRALRKLTNLLKPGGKIVISLKFGMTPKEQQERSMFAVSVEEVEHLAQNLGLFSSLVGTTDKDKLGRDAVYWQTLVLQLPDDGTGAFPFIRHVAINDGKAATHKLALLRVLLRIADGHPGAVLRRESSPSGDRVILPVGLVALYWCHQYKGLIDTHQLYQTPNKSPNMGFMKAEGWHKLTHRTAADYRIGNMFLGDDAIALHKTLSAAVTNIKTMPCRYITLPNSDQTIFEVDNKTVRAKDSLFLDLQTLEQWGEFSLPESTWLAFNRYACWIEPVLVSEWVKTMASYTGNQQYAAPENQYYLHQALNWLEPKRSTSEVRTRFEKVKQQCPELAQCVWSAKSLKRNYDIDHSMPFARWPNNDLWNLLPTDSKINNQKSDRLPTEQKLKEAKERIQSWWQQAWLQPKQTLEIREQPASYNLGLNQSNSAVSEPSTGSWQQDKQSKRFFAEANIALPGLNSNNQSIDDLFEALVLQRGRLKDMQQLAEW